MKNILSISLIAMGAFSLTASSASAQSVTALPSGFTAFKLSPSGTTVSGQEFGAAAKWSGGVVTALPGAQSSIDGFSGGMNFDGSQIAGRFEHPGTLLPAPGYYQTGLGVNANFPAGYADSCFSSTASSMSWAGDVAGVTAELGCKYYPFRWNTVSGTYQLLDTTSIIVPMAEPSARVSATSGDGLVSGGWIQTSNRSGAIWDQAGFLTFPFKTFVNEDGAGEVFGMDYTGNTVVGISSYAGPAVVRDGVIYRPAFDAGLASSGEGMRDISADGLVAVGAGGGMPGPFGSPDTGLIWTDWAGGEDINRFFEGYGLTLPTGNQINRAIGVSLDGHTFLVQEPPAFIGYGDSFIITIPNSWGNLGGNSSTGANGIPQLKGHGYLTDLAPLRLSISQVASNSTAFVSVSGTASPIPLWGGVLHTASYFQLIPVPTDAAGEAEFNVTWPAGIAGATLYTQVATIDFTAPDNVTLTNALSATGY